jgi:2,4-dienoyl-CoA reductase-like NADH-dependent reductase (Old Yellow Enzyme family)
MVSVLDPVDLGSLRLSSRIVMAPMTRARVRTGVPDDLTVLYYRQRAGAGLIVSEGTNISAEGRGYAHTPGIWTDEQVAGWARVTQAVHDAAGHIFCQLWHVGRQSADVLMPDGVSIVCSMAETARSTAWGPRLDGSEGPIPCSPPRALGTEEIDRVIADLVHAARNAIAAGFDGAEIHAANGYLFEQFINGALNHRTDRYGGSIANRLRFPLDALKSVIAAIGAERTGIRIAPFGRYGDMQPYADEAETWLAAAATLSAVGPAYIHLSDQLTLGQTGIPTGFVERFREVCQVPVILAGGFDLARAQAAIDAGLADLVAIGRPFIANPDLVARYRSGWPVAEPDRETFYGGAAKGYTDYPEHN